MAPEEGLEKTRRRLDNTWKVLTWSIGLYAAISMAVTGFAVSKTLELSEKIHGIDLRLTRIESNRFTSGDAAKLMQTLYSLEKRLPDSIPPSWFLKRVDKIEGRLTEIEREIHTITK